jgi:hypothetical protein
MKGIEYRYTNTCTIDYFILFIAIVFNYNNNISNIRIDLNWSNLFNDLKNYIFIKESWDLARYSFLTFKNHIKSQDLKDKSSNICSINCFGSEYDSYLNIYNELQTYKWTVFCKSCNRVESGVSCSFSLRFVLKKETVSL